MLYTYIYVCIYVHVLYIYSYIVFGFETNCKGNKSNNKQMGLNKSQEFFTVRKSLKEQSLKKEKESYWMGEYICKPYIW